jgi:hypothetical protein
LKERDYFLVTDVNGKMVLKWIILKYERRVLIGFMGPRRRSCGKLV